MKKLFINIFFKLLLIALIPVIAGNIYYYNIMKRGFESNINNLLFSKLKFEQKTIIKSLEKVELNIDNLIGLLNLNLSKLDTILKYNAALFLSDTSKEGVIAPEDRKWLEEEIIPVAIKNGLKYAATIMDKNLFKKYYLKKIKEASQQFGMMSLRIFDDYEEGRKWLLSQEV